MAWDVIASLGLEAGILVVLAGVFHRLGTLSGRLQGLEYRLHHIETKGSRHVLLAEGSS